MKKFLLAWARREWLIILLFSVFFLILYLGPAFSAFWFLWLLVCFFSYMLLTILARLDNVSLPAYLLFVSLFFLLLLLPVVWHFFPS